MHDTNNNTGLASYKKERDPWIFQNSTYKAENRKISVTIGLDLGSSFTKAAIQIAGDYRYIVDWNGILESSSKIFTFPGEVTYNGIVYKNLKAPFLENTNDNTFIEPTIEFLSTIFTYCRGWTLHNCQDFLRNRNISWTISAGIPASTLEKTKLTEKYEKALKDAWEKSISKIAENNKPKLEDIHVMPEFLAETLGYSFSPQCQKGLHFLIDVGAQTLDLCTFTIVNKKNNKKHCIMKSSVSQDGVENLKKESSSLIYQSMAKVLQQTKIFRDPRSSTWENGLPVFMLGGGRNMPEYADRIKELENNLKIKLNLIPPVFPTMLTKDLDDDSRYRVLGAIGLCFDSDLFEFQPGHEIEDVVTPKKTTVRHPYNYDPNDPEVFVPW